MLSHGQVSFYNVHNTGIIKSNKGQPGTPESVWSEVMVV
jgi:hypothetical protein